jgi:hypothetical protein
MLESVQLWFFEPLRQNSPAHLAAQYWVPPIITIVLSGLFASILLPRWQSKYAKTRALAENRLRLSEELSVSFQLYIDAWRRLRQITELEAVRQLKESEADRKRRFVEARQLYRDRLSESCMRARFYFTDQASDEISKFLEWDEMQSAKRLDDLPDLKEWGQWRDRVISALRRE